MKARTHMICALLAIAMLFQSVAAMAAAVCEHSDGSRRIELPNAHAVCHESSDEASHDPEPAGPTFEACSDQRIVSPPAMVRPAPSRQLHFSLVPLPMLVCPLPDALVPACHRIDAERPPNTPLLSIGTVVLLI